MSDEPRKKKPNDKEAPQAATPLGKSSTALEPAPRRVVPGCLPPYKVLLHNDDVNTHDYVVVSIIKITHLSAGEARARMLEADRTGLSLLLVTHKERAELYQEQLQSLGLTVTIEPDV